MMLRGLTAVTNCRVARAIVSDIIVRRVGGQDVVVSSARVDRPLTGNLRTMASYSLGSRH